MSGASGLIAWGIFGALALIAVVTAASMILTMSMYRAGLALMSSFVALAGIFVLLNADMLAAIQIMMNVGGMLIMILFMVMLMMDPGGEMMWDMKRSMGMRGVGALSMRPPKGPPPPDSPAEASSEHGAHVARDDTEPPAQAPTVYTCPMHPEVRQPAPGNCPKCGMTLIPADDQRSAPVEGAAPDESAAPIGRAAHGAPTVYTCPMHPEVRQSTPGQCPKCGMTLVPAADTAQPAPEHAAALATGHSAAESHSERVGMCDRDKGSMGSMRSVSGAQEASAHSGHGAHSGLTRRQNYQMMVDMAMSTAQTPLALGLGALAAALLIVVVILTPWPTTSRIPTGDASAPVGVLLLGRYMVGFEGAAFLILAGIAGAVIFARRESHAQPPSAAVAAQRERVGGIAHTGHGDEHTGERQTNALGAHGTPERAHGRHATSVPQRDQMEQMDQMDQMDQMNQEDMTMSDETATPAGETIYTCPMHPEVRQNAPGNCPICGMFLVPVTEPPSDQPASGGHEGHGSHDA